jgi:hypothetical protein
MQIVLSIVFSVVVVAVMGSLVVVVYADRFPRFGRWLEVGSVWLGMHIPRLGRWQERRRQQWRRERQELDL